MCRTMLVAIHCALIQAILLFSPSVQSGEITYELIKGANYRVCVEYTKNLNSVNADEPMYCDRKIGSGISGFAEPVWREVEAEKRVPLYKKSLEIKLGVKYLPEQQRTKMLKQIDAIAERDINDGNVSVMYATFDLNNDHKREAVINVIQNDIPCVREGTIKGGAGEVYGIDESGNPNRRLRPLPGPSDVFLYQDRTFLDWWKSFDGLEGLIIYEPKGTYPVEVHVVEICRIRVNY